MNARIVIGFLGLLGFSPALNSQKRYRFRAWEPVKKLSVALNGTIGSVAHCCGDRPPFSSPRARPAKLGRSRRNRHAAPDFLVAIPAFGFPNDWSRRLPLSLIAR